MTTKYLIIQKIFSKIQNYYSNHFINNKNIPTKFNLRIPYFSQWESPHLVDSILSTNIQARKDPKWRQSGAKSELEYEFWTHHICGVACLKMILYHRNQNHKTIDLAKAIHKHGGYQIKKIKLTDNYSTHPSHIQGLIYKPFIHWINTFTNLKAKIASPLNLQRIIHNVSRGHYVIASVHLSIRDRGLQSNKTGGHLVLIVGYDIDKKKISLHNPSGLYQQSQENYTISFDNFNKVFANKGIIIK